VLTSTGVESLLRNFQPTPLHTTNAHRDTIPMQMEDSDDNADEQKNHMQHDQVNERLNVGRGNDTTTATAAASGTANDLQHLVNDEEMRLDYELQILRNMRLSFVSALNILESARDDLNQSIPHDIDELRRASERIRAALVTLREQIQ
jgi:sirohydrochlorin ferrochelatase